MRGCTARKREVGSYEGASSNIGMDGPGIRPWTSGPGRPASGVERLYPQPVPSVCTLNLYLFHLADTAELGCADWPRSQC